MVDTCPKKDLCQFRDNCRTVIIKVRDMYYPRRTVDFNARVMDRSIEAVATGYPINPVFIVLDFEGLMKIPSKLTWAYINVVGNFYFEGAPVSVINPPALMEFRIRLLSAGQVDDDAFINRVIKRRWN